MEKSNLLDLYKGMQLEEFQLKVDELSGKKEDIELLLKENFDNCKDLSESILKAYNGKSISEFEINTIEDKIGNTLLSLSSVASFLDISLYDVLIKKRSLLDRQ